MPVLMKKTMGVDVDVRIITILHPHPNLKLFLKQKKITRYFHGIFF